MQSVGTIVPYGYGILLKEELTHGSLYNFMTVYGGGQLVAIYIFTLVAPRQNPMWSGTFVSCVGLVGYVPDYSCLY